VQFKLAFYGDIGKLMDKWLEDNAKVVGQSQEVPNNK